MQKIYGQEALLEVLPKDSQEVLDSMEALEDSLEVLASQEDPKELQLEDLASMKLIDFDTLSTIITY